MGMALRGISRAHHGRGDLDGLVDALQVGVAERCAFGQGNYFARPVEAHVAEQLVQRAALARQAALAQRGA